MERLVDVSDSFIEEFKKEGERGGGGDNGRSEKADSYSFLSPLFHVSFLRRIDDESLGGGGKQRNLATVGGGNES